MISLRENLEVVRGRIDDACRRAGRDPSEVTLVAVSKTWPADVVADVIEAGAKDLGENRAQELAQKAPLFASRDLRWHFIGHLQSNKVRMVVGPAAVIHSVDRYGLAEAISRRAVALGIRQDVLIEVNVSGEVSKGGIEPGRCLSFAAEVATLEGLSVSGLMTMAPFADDPESSRSHFHDLRDLRDVLVREVPSAVDLSMGMTRDFEVAVEEGATMVRVGEAIFGPRSA